MIIGLLAIDILARLSNLLVKYLVWTEKNSVKREHKFSIVDF